MIESSVNYNASPTMARFHQSEAFVRALLGPIGSGKSVACVIEMLIKSFSQEPDTNGIRKTRWVVIRNTYRELVDTTIQTFFDWFPEALGIYMKKDMKFTVEIQLPDGTTTHTEFLFRALDKPNDIRKLLSLEVTGGWINECREVPKQVMDMLIGRLGRYPRKQDGKGATWFGLILDTNAPDSDHWFYNLFEVAKPELHELFHQPSGTSPQAENVDNLPDGYYQKMQAGKDKEWIKVYVDGEYGFVMDGKPVYPEYKDDVHYQDMEFSPDPSVIIYVGIDFGLTPAAVFGQQTSAGRWIIFDELVTSDMGADTFSRLLNEHINRKYPEHKFEIYGDPSGDFRSQTDEVTPFQILAKNGVIAWPTYTNDPLIRREAAVAPMMRVDFAGNIAFVINAGAPMLRKALAGGYKYRRMAVSGQERYTDMPDKGRYSHVADAHQYLMVGAGEGGKVISNDTWADKLDYSHIDSMVI